MAGVVLYNPNAKKGEHRISFAKGGAVYIHYNRDNAIKSIGTKELIKPNANKFNNIKSRYLAMLKQTISPKSLSYNQIQQLSEVDFEKLMLEVQQGAAEGFNRLAGTAAGGDDNPDTYINQLLRAAETLTPGAVGGKSKTGKSNLQALNDIIEIIDQNKEGLGTWQQISSNKALPQFLSAQGVSLAMRVKEQLGRYVSANGTSVPEGVIKDIRTQVSEYVGALGAYASAKHVKKIDNMVVQEFNKAIRRGRGGVSFTGSQSTKTALDGGRMVETKAADSTQLKYVKKEFTTSENNTLTLDFLVNEATTTKFYAGKDKKDYLKMVSSSGINSLVTDALRKSGAIDSPGSMNIAYNSLAFSYNKGSEDAISKNYRIIRSHVIAEHGEKFLVGAAPAQTQGLLVVNGRAYSILEIIAKIVEQATLAAEKGEDVGSGQNTFFSVQISQLNKEANKWVGDPKKRLAKEALERSGNARKAIEGIRAYGKLYLERMSQFPLEGVDSIDLNLT